MNGRANQQISVSLQRNSLIMKKTLFLFLLVPLFGSAQDKNLVAEGISPNLFINHKVAPKENYYSIGRIYNISPKDIAPFNKLQLDAGLSLGQQVKIPLNSSNFFQSGNAEADETFVPVYYAVKDKEGLYRIGVNHNNLPVETLKEWNNIKGDAVKPGTKLIIGYLKVKKELSALAKNGIGDAINAKAIAAAKPDEKKPAEVQPKTETAKTKPADPAPVKTVKEEVVKADKPEPVKPVKETAPAEVKKTNPIKSNPGESFKTVYDAQGRNSETATAEGNAGVFKSTSGWTDKKYYCLYNGATAGTIVKITNPANRKFVFAKVLDLMPDIKKNEGLLLVVSNAAADELGTGEVNFSCSISYSK